MQRFRLMRPGVLANGTPIFTPAGTVALTDDARGADRYLELRRQGFALQRLKAPEDGRAE